MRLFRRRFTVWRLMCAVAVVAIGLGLLVWSYRWLQRPHINLTVFNESSAPIRDVRVSFLFGERTVDMLRPGGIAVAEIQSGGDAGVYFSYRDSRGIVRKTKPIYHDTANCGFVELHVADEGTRVIDGMDVSFLWLLLPDRFIVRVKPTGQMVVK